MNINTNLAYAAGYIDGDGCFYIGRSGNKFINHLQVVSTNKEILKWFKINFGGTISSPRISKFKTHKPIFSFSQRKIISVPFTQKIIPYLIEKYEEAIFFTEFSYSKNTTQRMLYIDHMHNLKNFSNLVKPEMKYEFEAIRNTIEPIEQDFAYLAGFIDAECCFGIRKEKPKNKPNYVYKIELQCNNTKAPIFKWLLQRFGGTIKFIERKTKNPKWRNQFSWRISGKNLANILEKIYPFLQYKKPVCEQIMKFNETILPNGGARHTEIFRGSYAKVIEKREKIVTQIHILNKKGI